MSMYNDVDDGDLIDAVLSWADTNPEFDPEFVESLGEYYEKKGELTDSQRRALVSIAEKWKIRA